jgi:hypothetical protein
MVKIDLTQTLTKTKGARVAHYTIYTDGGRYFGFGGTIGIGFVKYIKSNKALQLNAYKRIKWYISLSQSLEHALRQVRKYYGIRIASKGWAKYKVKAYNTTCTNDLIITLKKHFNNG